tara:strand:- start:601 stop:1695 length:1095 start_codon:yes stop_codon:yes gene_type:complete
MNSLGFNKLEKDTKVVVAMSGGVDSSVAAVMLKKEGYDVTGITLKLYSNTSTSKNKSCCAGIDIEDAKNVAKKYNIKHFTLDYQDKFFNGVINNFVDSYSNGETPLPCVQCNQTVKFSDLLNESKKMGADTLVTGHYAIRKGSLTNASLHKAKDLTKDQSFFLFATLQDQLNFVRFPLGNYNKTEIRKFAQKYELDVSSKPDSQDICFVTSDSYRDLIKKLNPNSNQVGNIYDINGDVIGEHKGIANYTIGQRKGLGISGFKEPLYVIEVNKKNNSITLGPKNYLKKNTINFKNINWLGGEILNKKFECSAKIRSTQEDLPGILEIKNELGSFTFDNHVEGTSPGQACVFYKNDQLLGGGWITS